MGQSALGYYAGSKPELIDVGGYYWSSSPCPWHYTVVAYGLGFYEFEGTALIDSFTRPPVLTDSVCGLPSESQSIAADFNSLYNTFIQLINIHTLVCTRTVTGANNDSYFRSAQIILPLPTIYTFVRNDSYFRH
ncbi:hypothetical protein [Hoylesella pleuritidis]|uniref:hypothetical protein n=1 Tax=Hoylesella pleuritidis TaxID=407975 RepID=UPI002355E295|nr:hypothetical protein [Hoylesella pleuritidis]